jgi:hypothetical protein
MLCSLGANLCHTDAKGARLLLLLTSAILTSAIATALAATGSLSRRGSSCSGGRWLLLLRLLLHGSVETSFSISGLISGGLGR